MRERQLKRDKTSCVSVAGLVTMTSSENIEAVLNAADAGGIDPSGLAFIVTDNRIRVWKQEIFSLSEEIIQDLTPVIELEHPSDPADFAHHEQSGNDKSMTRSVALAPHAHSYAGGGSHRRMESIYNGMGLYWSSPNGSICYWNDISESQRPCDVSVSLPLRENEIITYVTLHDTPGATNAGSILVGTSMRRTFHVWKNARPLELQARLLLSDELKESNATATSSQGGLLSGMYSYMFTPSKPKRHVGYVTNDAENGDSEKQGKASIVGIYHFSSSQQMQLFSPTKRMKHTHPGNRDPSKSKPRIYTIADNGLVDVWTSQFDPNEGAYTGNHVGCTDISNAIKVSMGENLISATVLCADMDIGANAASIVACLKASVSDENGMISSRYYLSHIPIDVETGQVQSESCTSEWLTCYANHAISSSSNPLVCAGIECTVEDSGITGDDSSTVVYCAFHQMKPGGHLPVYVSSVRFASDGSGTAIIDIDMPTDISPHIVPGCLQHDSATNGCNIICTSGCVTNARAIFPKIAAKSTSSSRSLNAVDKGMVDVLVGHLYSAFHTHLRKNESLYGGLTPWSPRLDRGSSPFSKRADLHLLPPSIANADVETLSMAVIAVSAQLADQPVSPSDSTIGDYRVIEEKVSLHKKFIKYLIHVGVYKRVNFKGRLVLRDHGEMMYAIGGLFEGWNNILESDSREQNLHEALDEYDADHREELLLFGDLLKGLAKKVTAFPEKFLAFQQELLSTLSDNGVPTSNWAVFVLLLIHYKAIHFALTYRCDHSDKLYDIPDLEEVSLYHENEISPWTSGLSTLASFNHSLNALQVAVSADEDRQRIYEQMQEKIGVFVKNLATSWLDGYFAIHPSARNEGDYDLAKELSYTLLSAFCPPTEESNIAFELSLAHAYFFGVVETCHQHSRFGRYDAKHNLESLVSDPPDSLAHSVDHSTGLSFQKYVLRWHTDREMFGTVLKLGINCQDVLSVYMEEDERLAHMRWIQDVRSSNFTKASTGLIGLSSDGIAALGEKPGHQSLDSRQLVMSLAKLSALASPNSLQSNHVQTIAQENLDLCDAQEILASMVDSEVASHRPMDANELMSLAIHTAQSANDDDVKFRASLAGLSIAKTMNTDGSISNTTREANIAKVWAVSINADADIFSELIDQWELLSDGDKVSRLEGTVFYNVANKYYADPTVQKNDDVGFAKAQNEVIRLVKLEKEGLDKISSAVLSLCRVHPQ